VHACEFNVLRLNRKSLLPLFYMADLSEIQVTSYIDLGEVLVAAGDDEIVG